MAVTRDGTRGVLEADAREWGLTLRQSLSLATVAPIIALVGLALVPFRDVFTALADEDGPVEYAQWALIVGLVVLYALIGRLLWRRDMRRLAILYLVGAAGFVFIGGEEVSWGQRILGFATPDGLGEINKQGEANVHNIGSVLLVFNITVVAICAGAMLLPILRWTVWRDRARSLATFALIPPLAVLPFFLFPFAYRITRWVFLPTSGQTITHYAEFMELCFYFGLFAFAMLTRRALSTVLEPEAAVEPHPASDPAPTSVISRS